MGGWHKEESFSDYAVLYGEMLLYQILPWTSTGQTAVWPDAFNIRPFTVMKICQSWFKIFQMLNKPKNIKRL